jgi:hypothetical protein
MGKCVVRNSSSYLIVNCARTVATTFESPTRRTSASVTVCAKHEARRAHMRRAVASGSPSAEILGGGRTDDLVEVLIGDYYPWVGV